MKLFRIIENRYDSYFTASTAKNTAIGLTAYKKWSVRKESHAQTICKKIFEKLVKKENEHYPPLPPIYNRWLARQKEEK